MVMRLETLRKVGDMAITLYYMCWKLMMALPFWIRRGIELVIFLAIFVLIMLLVKRLAIILCSILQKLVCGLISIIQICLEIWNGMLKEQYAKQIARIDESTSDIGIAVVGALEWCREKVCTMTIKRMWCLICFAVLYIIAILPETPLVTNMNETYQTIFAGLRNQMVETEQWMTPNINQYPDVFLKKKVTEEYTSEQQEEIYLLLNADGTNGSFIRSEPDINGAKLEIITSDNQIRYLNEAVYDGQRYWLKVEIDDGRICGWLSGKLVQEEQMKLIELQEEG